MNKHEWRIWAKRRRDTCPVELRRALGEQAQKKILADPKYCQGEAVALFISFGSECDTGKILEDALQTGKRVYLPKVIDQTRMEFYRVRDITTLKPGYQGIMEPTLTEEPMQEENIFFLVPGLLFDEKGGRLGYGGGYYDRYFHTHDTSHFTIVGYGFLFQRIDNVPMTLEDFPLDAWYASEEGEKMDYLETIGKAGKEAAGALALMGSKEKEMGLLACAKALEEHMDAILAANEKDQKEAKEHGMKAALLDRLSLNEERVHDMAEGLRKVAGLPDPIGEVLSMEKRPNGLMIGQRRVPMGVVGVIYESRPNVTVDTFGLCFKSGNSVILRGGSDCFHSNLALVTCLQEALLKEKINPNSVLLVGDTSHALAEEFMKCQYLDLLIPRGGAKLIQTVVSKATVPVIETGTGNCHIYVDSYADFDKAIPILVNAKTQRLGVCNACESLVVHEDIAASFLPLLFEVFQEKGVEMRGCQKALKICPEMIPATEEDFGTEYLDAIISIKVVSDIQEAIAHINRYNTGHSEAIITEHYENAMRFLDEIDAACVYVNASTRFTDGCEFGFGAEVGISTQKLHARGPMGLKALTTTKYLILGNGQIRE